MTFANDFAVLASSSAACPPLQLKQVKQMAGVTAADDAQVYQFTVDNTTLEVPAQIDMGALSTRVVLAIQNLGANPVEIKPKDNTFIFGKGWQIAANGGFLILRIKPTLKIYAVCASGNVADLRMLELGVMTP